MMAKVQAADMLVSKAQNEIMEKIGQITAVKWMGRVELRKEAMKKEQVMDEIRAARGKSVTDAFRWNLAMARIKREKVKAEDEMRRMVCEQVLEGLVEEIVLIGGGDEEEGNGERVGLLEKMLSNKSKDVEKYRQLWERERYEREGARLIAKLKLVAVKEVAEEKAEIKAVLRDVVGMVIEGFREREVVEGVLDGLVDDVEVILKMREVAEVREEKKKGAEDGRMLKDTIVTELREKVRDHECRVQVSLSLDGVMKIVEAKAHEERRRRAILNVYVTGVVEAAVAKVATPIQRDVVVVPAKEPVRVSGEATEEIIRVVLDSLVAEVEFAMYKSNVEYIKASIQFENEVKQQAAAEAMQKRHERKLKRQKEKAKELRGIMMPKDFFGDGFLEVDFFVKSQEQLERAEVNLVLNDMLHEVTETQETLELRAAIRMLQENAGKTPHVSREESRNGSRRGSRDKEDVIEITEMLLIGATDVGASEDTAKLVKIQRASKAWLRNRDEASRCIARGLRKARVESLKRRLLRSAEKEKAMESEIERLIFEGKKIDFERGER